MAKLFYSLQEAAEKLNTSEAEVQKLIDSGQLQEFRDRDRIMLKVEQVNLLAGEGDDEGQIPLAESGELDAIQLADSGSHIGMDSPKEQTGISIFDADETEEADPSAVTHVQSGAAAMDFSTDLSSSGSGLMDLTRESDDTSLGGEALLEDIYADEGDTVDETVVGEDHGPVELFESTPDAEVGVAGPSAIMVADVYDPVWSGILGGAALAAVITLGFAVVVVMGALVTGSPAAPAVAMARDNFMAIAGGLAALTVVLMILGWLSSKVFK